MTSRYRVKHLLSRIFIAIPVMSAAILSGCLPSFADRWQPPSVIHAAIYRRDANALKKVIATQPQSVNKESYYGEEPYWLFGYVLPLSLATKREWHEGVAILLANGADAGKSETGGWTPMTRAISQRDFESVRLFLENGASPRQRAIKRDGSLGPSPLDDAVSTRDVDYGIFQILVKYGAVPDEDLSVESKIRLRELNWLNK